MGETSVKKEMEESDEDEIVLSLVKEKKKTQGNGSSVVRSKSTAVKGPEAGVEKGAASTVTSKEVRVKVKKEVKVEEDEDSEEERKPAGKPAAKKGGTPKGKPKDEEAEKPMRAKTSIKDEKGKKKPKNSLKKEEAIAVVKGKINIKTKKEKKAYDLPGQRHNPPEERDPLRIFYESLYNQLPGSEMASIWMMEWGLLPAEEAKKVHERRLRKGQQKTTASLSVTVKKKKASSPSTTVTVSKTASKSSKKRSRADAIDSYAEEDDDFSIPRKKNIKKKTPS